MGTIRAREPALLIAGIIAASTDLCDRALAGMTALWGPAAYRTADMKFDHTDYYEREMGRSLVRRWVVFEALIPPEELRVFKQQSNKMEADFMQEKKRRVNIDPGYVNEAKLVLASTKDYSHRIGLGGGIFAETTLMYHKGKWTALPWTYPDYASPAGIAFANEARGIFRKRIGRE